jgi:hypothetical protein
MRAGATTSTEAKNRTGWALWTEFIQEVGGDSPPFRRPDPDHHVRKRLLKNMLLLWCRTRFSSSLVGRTTCEPEGILSNLYAAKREHVMYAITFLTKGTTHLVTRALGARVWANPRPRNLCFSQARSTDAKHGTGTYPGSGWAPYRFVASHNIKSNLG